VNARAALVPALVAVLLTGCAAGQEQQDTAAPALSPSSTPEPSALPSQAETPTPTPTASPTPSVRTVTVAYAGGQVTGTSGREEVPVGEPVVLRISSDVAEEVHVHGYDAYGDIAAGGSVDIPLTADIPGVFEVELHDSGKVLFQLRVG
jgi:glucose/arabinose dehydrogenase